MHGMNDSKHILFLCTGNSCRSQMAEGWARRLAGDACRISSAGLEAHGLNEHAVKVMADVGVDISTQESSRLDSFEGVMFDLVVTVCGHAHETCPAWPGGQEVRHMPFDDPPALAREAASPEEALGHYSRVRDEIRVAVAWLGARLGGRWHK